MPIFWNTKATKLGNGAFEVRGFRPCSDYFSSSSLSGMSDYNVARLSLASESSASCTVKYNPKVGLETVVRDPRLSDTFYKVTQKIGGEPKVDESVLKNISGASLETAKKGIEEIKSVIGRVIPTLKDIK